MKTSTASDILRYIENNQQSSVKELVDHFGLSQQAIQRQLKKLVGQEKLTKVGSPPRVFYQKNIPNLYNIVGDTVNPSKKKVEHKKYVDVMFQLLEYAQESAKVEAEANINTIQSNFVTVTNGNNILQGNFAFEKWCENRQLNITKSVEEYVSVVRKYNSYKNKQNIIDATAKFQSTFHPSYLNKAYYIDFYSIERFGKTKLGTYILYAKQSQSIQLMKEVFKLVDEPIMNLIKSEKIDAIGYIPPTISRKIQFMAELKRMLAIELPEIKITKIKSPITIAQKTLSKLSDREENARNTMFIEEKRKFKNILLIDDAVGSGSTFNEVAKKIRKRGIVSGNIIGVGLTGSANGIVDTDVKKGFPIINEV
jgi:DNA-binding Lrp family transcriptional regulator